MDCGCELDALTHEQTTIKQDTLHNFCKHPPQISPPLCTHNWRRDKLVIMSWNEQWRWVDWHAGVGVTLLLLALCRLRLYPTGLKNSKMKTVTATTDRHITNIITHTAGLYGSATHTNTHTCKYQTKSEKLACHLQCTTLEMESCQSTLNCVLKLKVLHKTPNWVRWKVDYLFAQYVFCSP